MTRESYMELLDVAIKLSELLKLQIDEMEIILERSNGKTDI